MFVQWMDGWIFLFFCHYFFDNFFPTFSLVSLSEIPIHQKLDLLNTFSKFIFLYYFSISMSLFLTIYYFLLILIVAYFFTSENTFFSVFHNTLAFFPLRILIRSCLCFYSLHNIQFLRMFSSVNFDLSFFNLEGIFSCLFRARHWKYLETAWAGLVDSGIPWPDDLERNQPFHWKTPTVNTFSLGCSFSLEKNLYIAIFLNYWSEKLRKRIWGGHLTIF